MVGKEFFWEKKLSISGEKSTFDSIEKLFYPILLSSPSGIQLKSKEEIKDYLLTEGTCKCGLDCPVQIENAFDFDHKV